MKTIWLCLVFLILAGAQITSAQEAAQETVDCPIAVYQKPPIVRDTALIVYFDAIPVKSDPETTTYAFTFRRQLPPPTDPVWKLFYPGYRAGVEQFDRTSKLWSFHLMLAIRYDNEEAMADAMAPLAALWKVEVRQVPSNRAAQPYPLRDLLIPRDPPQDPGKIKP